MDNMLTVYRNAQAVFLPAMTSNGDPSFWRILKLHGKDKEPIKDGDDIRLCWRFADQTGGYRDYHDDAFGRRRFYKPDDMSNDDVLYLKVPFPRFEAGDSKAGIALVMSTAETTKPVLEKITPLQVDNEPLKVNYNLHDLSFRLDTVGTSHITCSQLPICLTIFWG